jgi:peroxiredoxin
MTIQIGDRLPDAKLTEYNKIESPACSVGPHPYQVSELVKGKKIAIIGVPGAFTPACSAKHLPGFVSNLDAIKGKGIDEVWCVAVNDAFVMGAWGDEQQATGKVRMMADGSAEFTKAMGLEMDLTKFGMGVRSKRYSMLVEDGVVKQLNIEPGSKVEVSSAETLLEQL